MKRRLLIQKSWQNFQKQIGKDYIPKKLIIREYIHKQYFIPQICVTAKKTHKKKYEIYLNLHQYQNNI